MELVLCGHTQADFDMFEFYQFALVYVGKLPREQGVEKHPVVKYRRECWVDKEGNFRCDVSEAWEERMAKEFVVASGSCCELCYYGMRVTFSEEFMTFIEGPRTDRRTGGIRCQGRITAQDLGVTPEE